MSIEKWVEDGKGNLSALGSGRYIGTVYRTNDGCWTAVWNHVVDGLTQLKGKRQSAEEVQEIIEQAEAANIDPDEWYPPDSEWQSRKGGGCYRKAFCSIVSVKQAASGSWFASTRGALLGHGGRPSWFATQGQAMTAVDQLEQGRNDLEWIRR